MIAKIDLLDLNMTLNYKLILVFSGRREKGKAGKAGKAEREVKEAKEMVAVVVVAMVEI